MEVLRKTQSVCPECQKRIDAEVYDDNGMVWIRKTCPEHGEIKEKYWEDTEMYLRAKKYAHDGKGVDNPNVDLSGANCPFDCGLCRRHKSHTMLANIVLTNRCDLNCWYCFFFAKEGEAVYEPSLDELRKMVRTLHDEKPVPCNAVQYTGGEPTMRPDLLEIIKLTKEEGIDHVQLNTNGINLAFDSELTMKIREAGVNTMYLSFDGVTPKTNPKNHYEIPRVFENCRKADIGIVLVPTVINTINDHELGDIVRFGVQNQDIVRGVNFQPVSLVGRMPKKEREKLRITIPKTIKKIEEQTNGDLVADDFYPVPCTGAITNFVEAITSKPRYSLSTHFACGMATYLFIEDNKILPITRFVDVDGLFRYLNEKTTELQDGKSKYVVGMKLLAKINSFIDKEKAPKDFSIGKMIYNALLKHDYSALGVFHHKSMFIGMMHFMDQFNYDIQRVERCGIHYAVPDGRIIPFCTFNVVSDHYRDKIQEQYAVPAEKWENTHGEKLKAGFYKRESEKLVAEPIYKKTYAGFV